MLDDQDLENLFSDLESDRVERKSSAANHDKIAEAVCAFANDLPENKRTGVVFVGVKDDGTFNDLLIGDDLLKSLGEFRYRISPFPNQPFDLYPVPFATLDDLDLLRFEREYLPVAVAPDILERNGRSIDQKLSALRFATPEGQADGDGRLGGR